MTLKTIMEWEPGQGLSVEEIQRIKDDWRKARKHSERCRYRECRRLQGISPSLVVAKVHGASCCPCNCNYDARMERRKARMGKPRVAPFAGKAKEPKA